jgi:capsular exopolysaccharide synthesis family protein
MPNEVEPSGPSLISYLHLLRRRRHWVIGLIVAAILAALGYAFTAQNEYTASAQILVQPPGSTEISGSQVTILPADIQTALQLVNSAPVKGAVARLLGSAPKISAAQVGQTNVIQITATSAQPSQAAKIANAYSTAFVGYERTSEINTSTAAEAQVQAQINSITAQISSLQGQNSSTSVQNQIAALLNQESVLKEQLAQLEVNGAVSTGGVQVVSPASIPTSPSSPKKLEDIGLGGLAGILLGVGVAFLLEYLDDTVYSTEDVQLVSLETPLLALIPVITSWRNSEDTVVVTLSDPASPVAESYRSLRTSLQFAGHERSMQTILVTSPSAAEGKTSTVSNLAVVLASAGQRVIVVSADLRRPRIGQFFGMSEETGLTSVILSESLLADAVQAVENVDRLALLGTGPLPPNPAELLQSARTGAIIDALKKSFDIVLIDSPPVLPVTDAVILAGRSDVTLLVVAAGRTKRRDLAHAIETLSQVNAPRMGVVLNAVAKEAGYGHGDGYGYRYTYRPTTRFLSDRSASNGAVGNGNGQLSRFTRKEPRHARRSRD